MLETDFNEDELVRQIYRVAMPDASLCFFGRGSSFARLQKKFADYLGTLYKPDGTLFGNIYDNASEIEKAGLELLISNGYKAVYISKKERFEFKESIIWDKLYCSSPVLPMSRVHEDAVIFMRGNKKVNKVKVPYLEMKKHDLKSIIQDIKRITSALGNTKSLAAMKEFLENNKLVFDGKYQSNHSTAVVKGSDLGNPDPSVGTLAKIQNGSNEKTLIAVQEDKVVRNDFKNVDTMSKHEVVSNDLKVGDISVITLQSLEFGMNEKTVIRTDFDGKSLHNENGTFVGSGMQKMDVNVTTLQSIENGMRESDLITTENETEINSSFCVTLNPETIKDKDKATKVLNGIENGLNEKTLVRTDLENGEYGSEGHNVSIDHAVFKNGDRNVGTIQTIESGMTEQSLVKTETEAQNEKYEHTILEQIREHYGTLHPTQKPVRLMYRIIKLISNKGETICDLFCGAGATGVACVEAEREFIGFEIYNEPTKVKDTYIDGYFTSSWKRYEQALQDKETTKLKALQEAKDKAFKEAQKGLF